MPMPLPNSAFLPHLRSTDDWTTVEDALRALEGPNEFYCNPRQFGGTPSGGAGADQSGAIGEMFAFANENQTEVIDFGPGIWPIDAELPAFTYIPKVFGSRSAQPTILHKRYVASSATRGLLQFGTFGFFVEGIDFSASAAASGGAFISAVLPGPGPNSGKTYVRNMAASGGLGINYNIFIDGTAAAGAGGAPKGYRQIFFENLMLFGTAAAGDSVCLNGVEHLQASNCMLQEAGGTSPIMLRLSGTGDVPSFNVVWTGVISGDIALDYFQLGNFLVNAVRNITNTANTSDVLGRGATSGTVQANWSNSQWEP
jgi:hypothetical protein